MESIKRKRSLIGKADEQTMYSVLVLIGIAHLLNDSLQAVVPAMFPILERSLGLTFTQLGLIAFTLNMIASVMQPVIGSFTDKHPRPYVLPIGMISSMFGMLLLSIAPNFYFILLSVVFIAIGSATFHPEGSRVAYMAAGPRRGFAQSIFQVGGNAGQSLAPLITALVLVPLGQFGTIWFTLVAGLAVIMLFYIASWYKGQLLTRQNEKRLSRKETSTAPKKSCGKRSFCSFSSYLPVRGITVRWATFMRFMSLTSMKHRLPTPNCSFSFSCSWGRSARSSVDRSPTVSGRKTSLSCHCSAQRLLRYCCHT